MISETQPEFPELAGIEFATNDVLAPFAQRIRELESIINEPADKGLAEELAADAIHELNTDWPFMSQQVETLGEVFVAHQPPEDDIDTQKDDDTPSSHTLVFGRTTTPGLQGASLGFSCITEAVHIDEEYVGDRHILTHKTQLDPIVLSDTDAYTFTLGAYAHSQPHTAAVVALELPRTEELGYTRPDFMTDIDISLYNPDTLSERLAALGELVISEQDVAVDKEIDYCRYINQLLTFDSLPYAIEPGSAYAVQLEADGSMTVVPLPSPKLFARLRNVVAMPRLYALDGSIRAGSDYQFAVSAQIIGEDNRTLDCFMPLSEPMNIINLREFHS